MGHELGGMFSQAHSFSIVIRCKLSLLAATPAFQRGAVEAISALGRDVSRLLPLSVFLSHHPP